MTVKSMIRLQAWTFFDPYLKPGTACWSTSAKGDTTNLDENKFVFISHLSIAGVEETHINNQGEA